MSPALRVAIGCVSVLLCQTFSFATCPSPAKVMQTLGQVSLERSARTAEFGQQVPTRLYERAAAQPGRPFAARDGKAVGGVVLVERPIAELWQAVSDDTHFDDVDLPVNYSARLEHEPGRRRLMLQSFEKWGMGRWWISEVVIDMELFQSSGGKLWEQVWHDRSETARRKHEKDPRVQDLTARLTPMDDNRGVWLMIPIAERCTFLEYFSISNPGGFAGSVQWIGANGAIRDTLRGIVDMATHHTCTESYLRPDGKPNTVSRK